MIISILVILITGCNSEIVDNRDVKDENKKCTEIYLVSRDINMAVIQDVGVTNKQTEFIPTENFEDYFEILNTTDATGVKKTEVQVVGVIKLEALTKISPKEIIKNLINSEKISTYWHLGATICLKQELDNDELYFAYFTAVHEYCTNECLSENYAFSVEINKIDGEIVLKGQ
ncbi:MAG: hypothetical protein ABIG89_02035 [Candidatus Woesearchaeota archaeon]